MKRTITPHEVRDLLGSEEPLIIDVRRRADLEADPEMIPGAVWRDPQQVEMWSQQIPPDRDVVIYCVRGGSVSNSVLDLLVQKGVRARYVEGGIAAWKEAKNPVLEP